jgi:hypothetical protein
MSPLHVSLPVYFKIYINVIPPYTPKSQKWAIYSQHILNCDIFYVTFQVLRAASMKMTAFWDVAPCTLVEVDLMMEAVSTCETSVYFYETT